MALGHVVDMDEIEAGIEKARHAASRRLDDDAAGRRRLDVARPDRGRGVDDDRGERVTRDHGLDQPFRGDLAALVGADPLRLRQADGLVGGAAVVMQLQGRDAAAIDDALDSGAARLFHDDAGAVDIGGENLAGIARPQPIIGGDVKDIADPLHGLPHGCGVAQIPGRKFEIEPGEMKAGAAGPHQRPYRKSLGDELSRDRRSDETGSPGDKRWRHGAHDASIVAANDDAIPQKSKHFCRGKTMPASRCRGKRLLKNSTAEFVVIHFAASAVICRNQSRGRLWGGTRRGKLRPGSQGTRAKASHGISIGFRGDSCG